MEILLTRPLLRSLDRSACLVEDAAVALFLISITSSSRITALSSDGSTLVWDSVPLMAHNARFKATKHAHDSQRTGSMVIKGRCRRTSPVHQSHVRSRCLAINETHRRFVLPPLF